MSMLPADPPPPVPDPGATPAEWTTAREVPLECAGCGAAFVLAYKYRFVEGLAATVVRCPAPACGRGREYYLPVNAFDVVVAAPDGALSPPSKTC